MRRAGGTAALIDRGDPEIRSVAPAVSFDDQTLTYAQLRERVSAMAARLAGVGVESGHAVGLVLPNGLNMIVALYACWWRGATAVPMNHTQTARELRFAIEDAQVSLVLVHPDQYEVAREAGPEGRTFAYGPGMPPTGAEALPPAGGMVEPEPVAPEDPAVVIFTSGTTGRPKGAVLSHGSLDKANAAIGAALKGRPGPYDIKAGDRPPTLVALPLSHTGGLCSLIFAHYAGRHAVVLRKFRLDDFLMAVERHGVDTVVATPTMLQMLLHAPEIELPGVRMVQSSGAPLPPSVKSRFEARFGIPIIQNYGQTEALHVAGWTREELTSGTWRPGSVGRPYAGVELRILSDDGVAQAPDEIGEIVVRSDHTMSMYIGAEARDGGAVDPDGWLFTGDLGYLDADGYLFVVDRKREMLLVGGFNVYPAEIENVLLDHPDVSEVVVVGIPDERLGEVPHAFVVPLEGRSVSAEALVAYTRENLAHYKAVRGVTVVEGLPQTHSQKIKRKSVRDMALSSAANKSSDVPNQEDNQ
ncbi:O-succinylbenzoic acid--CoA ligase [Euzebya pacifica]|uniref:O-succinylbenzoic acid--CoA ligase n=1 Tax=Euzebya pacifica TaxID=1608957 RepID=A0A346XWQ1_9ACTN|nr:class I adenylate-forming enzyme family protein [Euzebya pacifica]AXV06648.1 O-succinylbenzoic acid--CoA ligase [Euzebya pacifica]